MTDLNKPKELTAKEQDEARTKIAAKRRAKHKSNRDKVGALAGQKLAAPGRKGYYRRWVNDDGTRLDDMKNLGYSHVTNSREVDKAILSSSGAENISQIVGTAKSGGPQTAFLMEIPEEFRNEDLQERENRIRQIEQQISSAEYGANSLGSGSGSKMYDPLERSGGNNNLLRD